MLYRMFMPKRAISITLQDDNLLWLKSRTLATKGRRLSETLDALVTAARTSGNVPASAIRSVANTVDIADDDPNLDRADDYVRDLFKTSATRLVVAREEPPAYSPGPSRSRSRR